MYTSTTHKDKKGNNITTSKHHLVRPPRDINPIRCRLHKIKPIKVDPIARTTELRAVPGTGKAALSITNIRPRRRGKRAAEVDGVSAPAFAAVFHTCVFVLRALGEAAVNSHRGAIVIYLAGKELAG